MITVKLKNFIIYFLFFNIIFLYLTNVENISICIFNALKFCIYTLIPALFPNLIISGLINDGTRGLQLFKKVKFRILGNCKIYLMPIITGMLCGFIVGPKALCKIYDDYIGDETDFSLSIALSSNAGIGFVIGCIGKKIWQDYYFGIFIYLCQLLSAFITFLILKSKKALTSKTINFNSYSKHDNLISKVITSTFNSLCLICSFYIFFSFILELISSTLNLNNDFLIILSSVLDFSTGIFSIDNLSNKVLAVFLTGFSLGFAGISIHLQTFFVCEGYPLKKLKFFCFKLIQGFLCGILSLIYILI